MWGRLVYAGVSTLLGAVEEWGLRLGTLLGDAGSNPAGSANCPEPSSGQFLYCKAIAALRIGKREAIIRSRSAREETMD